MRDDQLLSKATRINLLLDFYAPLLTEKQVTFLRLQYAEDFSLSEIAEQYEVSRQAVNDHTRRACELLEEYERKLMLADKHLRRSHLYQQLLVTVSQLQMSNNTTVESSAQIADYVQHLKRLDEG